MVTSEVINTDKKDVSVFPQRQNVSQNGNKSVDVYTNGSCHTGAPELSKTSITELADEVVKDTQSIKDGGCEEFQPILNGTSAVGFSPDQNQKKGILSEHVNGLCESMTNSLNMASESLKIASLKGTDLNTDFKHKTCDDSVLHEIKEDKYVLQHPITNCTSAPEVDFVRGKTQFVTNNADDIENVSLKENEEVPLIESEKLQSPQNRIMIERGTQSVEHILPGCASVDLNKMFKQTIGYKRQKPGFTYSSAKQSLKEFKEKETEWSYKEKCDFSLTSCAPNNEDKESLKVAVTQLQDLLDRNVRVKVELGEEENKADKEDFTDEKNEDATGKDYPILQDVLSTNILPTEGVNDFKPDICNKHGNESDDQVQKAIDKKLSQIDSPDSPIHKEIKKAEPSMNKPKKHYTGKFAIAHLLEAGSSLYENSQHNRNGTDSQENEETTLNLKKNEHNVVLDRMKSDNNCLDTQKNPLLDNFTVGSLTSTNFKPKMVTENQNMKGAREKARERLRSYQAPKSEDLTSDTDSDSTSTSDSIDISDVHITPSEYQNPDQSWLNQGQWPYLGYSQAHRTSPWFNHFRNQVSPQQFQSAYYYPPHTLYDPLWRNNWLYGYYPREKSTEYMNYHMEAAMKRCYMEQQDYIKAMCKNFHKGETSKPKKKAKKKKK